MANIQLNLDTQLNTDGQTTADQPQAQLHSEPVRSQPTNTMDVDGKDQGNMNQLSGLVGIGDKGGIPAPQSDVNGEGPTIMAFRELFADTFITILVNTRFFSFNEPPPVSSKVGGFCSRNGGYGAVKKVKNTILPSHLLLLSGFHNGGRDSTGYSSLEVVIAIKYTARLVPELKELRFNNAP
ncbi:hypothetical protein L1887_19977 [Cichorium endivia]|nr:hypothetical protein L1887_19977 [Cichorium endivia]